MSDIDAMQERMDRALLARGGCLRCRDFEDPGHHHEPYHCRTYWPAFGYGIQVESPREARLRRKAQRSGKAPRDSRDQPHRQRASPPRSANWWNRHGGRRQLAASRAGGLPKSMVVHRGKAVPTLLFVTTVPNELLRDEVAPG